MIRLYQILLLLASPLLLVWIAARAALGKLPGLPERFGFFACDPPAGGGPRLWIHAVSLGEVKVATALAADLRKFIPELSVIFTTSTRTGMQEAIARAAPRDRVLYPPIDLAWVCRRFLKHLAPNFLVIVETELWPNLISETARTSTPLLIVNARISDRSWPRYRATRLFWRPILGHVTHVFASSGADASRFLALGAAPGQLSNGGNLKFRLPSEPRTSALVKEAGAYRRASAAAKILVAGSTMPGEEQLLIDCFSRLRPDFPGLWMILAPRHPERFNEVAQLLRESRIAFSRRSEWREGEPLLTRGIMLLDTIGELASVYEICDVAFVGGTLVPTGGHNILEPASCGKAIVIGPSMENFSEVLSLFMSEDAQVEIPDARVGSIVQVQGQQALLGAMQQLLGHPEDAQHLGASARKVMVQNQEFRARTIAGIVEILKAQGGRARGDERGAQVTQPS